MILSAHQPAYLPWLGLFHKIALADTFVFMDDVKYSKSDASNRNHIRHPAQGRQYLTVPLRTGGSDNHNFADLMMDDQQDWQRRHYAVISAVYGRSPHFKAYADLGDFYHTKYARLCDLTHDMLLYFLRRLGIGTVVRRASSHALTSTKSQYLIDLCAREACDFYVFGALGRAYADLDAFRAAGLRTHFQDYQHPTYPQAEGPFVSHLSIIDLLFNCGEASAEILMSGNIAKATLEETPRP